MKKSFIYFIGDKSVVGLLFEIIPTTLYIIMVIDYNKTAITLKYM